MSDANTPQPGDDPKPIGDPTPSPQPPEGDPPLSPEEDSAEVKETEVQPT